MEIAKRSVGYSCPYCSGHMVLQGYNDLETTHPNLALEWHPTKNGELSPTMVSRGSNRKVWWECPKGHEWQATIGSRSKGSACPYCSGNKVMPGFNDLVTKNPVLAAEWHPTKNGNLLPSQVTSKSGKKVWWLCKHGHEWQAKVSSRANGSGCPECCNNRRNNNMINNRPFHEAGNVGTEVCPESALWSRKVEKESSPPKEK